MSRIESYNKKTFFNWILNIKHLKDVFCNTTKEPKRLISTYVSPKFLVHHVASVLACLPSFSA